MTKLLEWLCGLTLYIGAWLTLIRNKQDIPDAWDLVIYLLPVITLFVFGVYSISVILWRVYCFNDCPKAAEELQEQIKQARQDLKSKGLKF